MAPLVLLLLVIRFVDNGNVVEFVGLVRTLVIISLISCGLDLEE